MEKTLKLIVETDKASRQDIEKAKQRREELTKELSVKKEKIEKEYREKSEKAVGEARLQADRETENVSAKITAVTDERIASLEKIYEQNHKSWEDGIFKTITE